MYTLRTVLPPLRYLTQKMVAQNHVNLSFDAQVHPTQQSEKMEYIPPPCFIIYCARSAIAAASPPIQMDSSTDLMSASFLSTSAAIGTTVSSAFTDLSASSTAPRNCGASFWKISQAFVRRRRASASCSESFGSSWRSVLVRLLHPKLQSIRTP